MMLDQTNMSTLALYCCHDSASWFQESILHFQVEAEIEAAKKSDFPPIEDLWNNIYVDGLGAKLRPIEISKPKIQL